MSSSLVCKNEEKLEETHIKKESLYKNESTLVQSIETHKSLELKPHEVDNSQYFEKKMLEGISGDMFDIIEAWNPETNRMNSHYKCLFRGCNNYFKKVSNFRNHFKKHTGVKPFVCTFCSRSFSQKGNLHRHEECMHLKLYQSKQLRRFLHKIK